MTEPRRNHTLKTWPIPFEAVWQGVKTFEVRRDDRGFAVGDRLRLIEWDPATENLLKRYMWCLVTYLTHLDDFGCPGFVGMSIKVRTKVEWS